MLAHSEAKVDFFKTYLERYLRILYLSEKINEINIFDVFCGTGIYDNGKKGSPIVAFDAVKKLRDELGYDKQINLIVNDSKNIKVSSVQQYIESNNNGYCNAEYKNQSAEMMFDEIIKTINQQNKTSRNLIFIDPYGYKEIKKSTLEKILENERTEIILFLPISQMQRFTSTALENEIEPYKPLREFVNSFFSASHPIREKTVNMLEYIDYLKEALKFKKYYTTSYYIKRDQGIYYGLFFISSHIYGFQHILDVKWTLDEDSGRGFKKPEKNTFFSLFEAQEKELSRNENYQKLEKILKNALINPKTNWEVYEIILKNEFLPKHANEIFKNWQNESSLGVTEIDTGKPARKNSFYVNWKNYKIKVSKPKVLLKLL